MSEPYQNPYLTKRNVFIHFALRFLEILVAAVIFTLFLWVLLSFNTSCTENICIENSENIISEITFDLGVALGFSLVGILTSLRIAFVYLLNDPDDRFEYFFYISLFGLALSHILAGIFFRDLENLSGRVSTNWLPQTILLIIAGISALLLQNEPKIWSKTTSFVKWRLVFAYVTLILVLLIPSVSLFFVSFVIPLVVLFPGKIPKIEY